MPVDEHAAVDQRKQMHPGVGFDKPRTCQILRRHIGAFGGAFGRVCAVEGGIVEGILLVRLRIDAVQMSLCVLLREILCVIGQNTGTGLLQ